MLILVFLIIIEIEDDDGSQQQVKQNVKKINLNLKSLKYDGDSKSPKYDGDSKSPKYDGDSKSPKYDEVKLLKSDRLKSIETIDKTIDQSAKQECNCVESRYLQHYYAKNCKPINDSRCNCPVRFDCPSNAEKQQNSSSGLYFNILKTLILKFKC